MIRIQIRFGLTYRIGKFFFEVTLLSSVVKCPASAGLSLEICDCVTTLEIHLSRYCLRPLQHHFTDSIRWRPSFRRALCSQKVLVSPELAGRPAPWWKVRCLLPLRVLTCFSSPAPPPPPPQTTPAGTKPSGTHGGKLMTTISRHSWTETNSFHTAVACNQMVLCALLICNCPPTFIFFYS